MAEPATSGDSSSKKPKTPVPPPLFKNQHLYSKEKLLETMNQDEKKAFETLVTSTQDLPDDYKTPITLTRYLRARDFNVEKAEALLRSTIKWAADYKPHEILPKHIEPECVTGKLYVHGCDKLGRPVIYQKPRFQNTKDHVNQVRQLVFFMNRAVAAMNALEGVHQLVFLIDFRGYSMFNAPPMSVTMEVLKIVTDHFPERLGTSLMVDAPMLFYAAWRIVKPFVPTATQKKVHFVSCKGTHGATGRMDKVISEFFEPEMLEEDYGGTLPGKYEHEPYFDVLNSELADN